MQLMTFKPSSTIISREIHRYSSTDHPLLSTVFMFSCNAAILKLLSLMGFGALRNVDKLGFALILPIQWLRCGVKVQ